MPNLDQLQNTQKMRVQSSAAMGRTIRKPRANPWFRKVSARPRRANADNEIPFGFLALSILISDLLLSDKRKQVGTQFVKLPREGSRARQKEIAQTLHKKSHVGLRLFLEIRDIALTLWLLDQKPKKQRKGFRRAVFVRTRRSTRLKKRWFLRLATAVCLSLFAPRLALAQSDEVVTPVELFDPDQGDGVRISPSFILYPQAIAEFTYDTNIYNLDTLEVEDTSISIRPRAVIVSDFSRHAVKLEASADIKRYIDVSNENSEQYRVNATALLELGGRMNVEASGGYARGIERRGTAGDAFFTDAPVVFHDKNGSIEVSVAGNQIEVGIAGSILKRDYSDTSIAGQAIDLEFRDVRIANARGRADLRLSEKVEVFAETGLRSLDYDITSVPSRDSDGFYGLLGLSYEVSALVEIEAGVGFIHQDFDEPTVETAKEMNYRAEVRWTPKPEWRLAARASRDVDPSRIQEAPAIIFSSFRLTAERVLGDRLLVTADAEYLEEDYRGLERKDKRFTLSGSATYRLTDRIGLIFSAAHREQDGGILGRSYDGFSASVGLRAAW